MRSLSGLLPLLVLVGCAGDGDDAGPSSVAPVFGSGESGLVDGPAARARFNNPANVAVAPDGTVYVADFDNNAVRAIDTAGNVTTIIEQEFFQRPFGLAVLPDGTLYVQTDDNGDGEHTPTSGSIWWYNPATQTATIQASNLGRPRGMAPLPDGRLAISDLTHHTVSIFDPETGTAEVLAGSADNPGFANGTGTEAQFNRPYGLAVMADGSLLVADQSNNRLRKVTMAGVVTTFAGTGLAGSANGSLAAATFNGPQDVKIAPNGTIFVADTLGHVIRRIRGTTVSTFAGDGVQGYAPGTGTSARFYGLEGISLTKSGDRLWIADGNGGEGTDFNRVRNLPTN